MCRANRRVFNERDRFRHPDTTGQQGKTGFAHGPDQIHFVSAGHNLRTQPEPTRLENGKPFGNVLVVELNNQNRLTRFGVELHQIARSLEMKLAFGLVEQRPINVLDRRRFKVEQLDCRLHGIIDTPEKNKPKRFLTRQR